MLLGRGILLGALGDALLVSTAMRFGGSFVDEIFERSLAVCGVARNAEPCQRQKGRGHGGLTPFPSKVDEDAVLLRHRFQKTAAALRTRLLGSLNDMSLGTGLELACNQHLLAAIMTWTE